MGRESRKNHAKFAIASHEMRLFKGIFMALTWPLFFFWIAGKAAYDDNKWPWQI